MISVSTMAMGRSRCGTLASSATLTKSSKPMNAKNASRLANAMPDMVANSNGGKLSSTGPTGTSARAAATMMMNGWMKKANVAKPSELLEIAMESGVRMIACQMTMDVMGIKKEDLIDGLEIGGAASFLEFASENAIALAF